MAKPVPLDMLPDGLDDPRRPVRPAARPAAGASSSQPAPSSMSLDDIKKQYQQLQAIGARPEELAAVADAYVKKEREQGGFGLAVDDTIRQLAKGVPGLGGTLEEMAAGTSSLMGGNYDEALDYQRARDRSMEKGAPVLSTALQTAGGIAGTVTGARALGFGKMGVNAATPLFQRILGGAAIGVPVGAIDGFTRGEGGFQNRAYTAGMGGVLGGVTGAGAPLVGQGISSAYQNVKNALTPNASYRALGVTPAVGEEIVDYLGADAGNSGLARIRAAGPGAMLADAGPNVRSLADAVMVKGGPGASTLGSAINKRAQAASKNVVGTLDRALGKPEGAVAQITAIREGSAAAREAAYNNAYASPIDYSAPTGRAIYNLIKNTKRIPGEAWGYAKKLMDAEGVDSKQILIDIAPDGSFTFKKIPDVRTLDYVKRALDAVAEQQDGLGKLGGQTAIGRAYRKTATELRNLLKQNVQPYGAALESAADPISRIEGIKLGTKLLSPQYTRSELAEALEGMTTPERQAVMSGIRAQFDEIMANVRGTASDPEIAARQLNKMVQELTSDATKSKIAMVFKDSKKTAQFFREMGQSFKAAQLRAGIAANSNTVRRGELIRGIDERLQPGAIGTAMQGNIPGATQRVIQLATGATPRQQRLSNNEQWLELAKLLTEKRGRGAEDLLRKLMAAANARAASSATGQKFGVAGASAVAGTNPILVEGVK